MALSPSAEPQTPTPTDTGNNRSIDCKVHWRTTAKRFQLDAHSGPCLLPDLVQRCLREVHLLHQESDAPSMQQLEGTSLSLVDAEGDKLAMSVWLCLFCFNLKFQSSLSCCCFLFHQTHARRLERHLASSSSRRPNPIPALLPVHHPVQCPGLQIVPGFLYSQLGVARQQQPQSRKWWWCCSFEPPGQGRQRPSHRSHSAAALAAQTPSCAFSACAPGGGGPKPVCSSPFSFFYFLNDDINTSTSSQHVGTSGSLFRRRDASGRSRSSSSSSTCT